METEDIYDLIEALRYRATGAYPASSPEAIHLAEQELGFALPPLLKELYLEVGNGGFGPQGSTMIGLEGGWRFYERHTLAAFYQVRRNGKNSVPYKFLDAVYPVWPSHLLPVFCWPCSIYTCLYCAEEQAPVYVYDANFIDASRLHWPVPIMKHKDSFEEWLNAWVRGDDLGEEMYQLTLKESALYEKWWEKVQAENK